MAKTLPKTGTPREAVMQQLKALHADDAKWKDGRTFSLVYFAGDEVSALLKEAYGEFIAENGLSPVAFPSLRQMECEVVSMAAGLLNGNDDVAGTMTSGGTESIMMAIKAAREWGKKEKGLQRPHMIVPASAHPAFDKAVHYFDVDYSHAPLLPDFRVDVAAMEKLIRPETVLLVGSAPSYPHGVIDDITAIASLAKSRGILCHVDACLGGFFLPFARKLGRAMPAVRLRGRRRHLDVGRPAQVRLRGEGRLGGAVPERRAATAPVLHLRGVERRAVRVAFVQRHPPRRRDRRGLGGDAPPRRRGLPHPRAEHPRQHDGRCRTASARSRA